MTARPDDDSFRTLFEPHRRPITLHCYRMLGSLEDAEEIVQEALLVAWQRQGELRSGEAMRAWLYKIATNACFHQLRKARRRAMPHVVASASKALKISPPTDERLWVQPAPDALLDVEADAGARPDARAIQRESIGIAFIVALQFLSAKQRAALLLVDVLGWKPEEAAGLLEVSVASVNSLLQRARKSVEARKEDTASTPTSSSDESLLRRFIASWESGDLEAFSGLLAEDAILSMPPQAEWYAGREAVRAFFAAVWSTLPGERRLVPVRANGGPAVAVYHRKAIPDAVFEATGIALLAIRGGQISQILRFGLPAIVPLFGLRAQLASDDRDVEATTGGD